MSSTRRQGHSVKYFVNGLPDYALCSLCLEVLNNPYQCSNGHCFCKFCIEEAVELRQVCPVCNVSTPDLKAYYANLFARNAIDDYETKCHVESDCEPSDDHCTWRGLFSQRDIHIKECPYQLVKCSNGCDVNVQRRFHDRHLMVECVKRKCSSDSITDYSEIISNNTNSSLRNRITSPGSEEDCPTSISRASPVAVVDHSLLENKTFLGKWKSGILLMVYSMIVVLLVAWNWQDMVFIGVRYHLKGTADMVLKQQNFRKAHALLLVMESVLPLFTRKQLVWFENETSVCIGQDLRTETDGDRTYKELHGWGYRRFKSTGDWYFGSFEKGVFHGEGTYVTGREQANLSPDDKGSSYQYYSGSWKEGRPDGV